jgi:hypothetical protein
MIKTSSRMVWLAAAAIAAMGMVGSTAFAQGKKDAGVASQPTVAGAPPMEAPNAEVTGFRSAKFGMSEKDVRAAIAKDFNVKPDAIRSETNPSEQTHVLLVKASGVLPGGGTAEISYVLGFKSKTLIQVGVAWSKQTDDKMTPEQLFSNSSILRAHFVSAGYKPDTVASNMPINGGLLMFRGSDDKGRTTILILQGSVAQGENNQRVLTPSGLLLFYVADAKTPDIYRLPPGSF